MITGFNTDIKFNGVTYHVQTEDKGLRTPLILSLVYQGGTILASKRSPYEDLLVGEFDEKILEDRLNRQHNLICAAIRAGRIEDLRRMTKTSSTEAEHKLVAKKEVESEKVIEEKVETELITVTPIQTEVESIAPESADILEIQPALLVSNKKSERNEELTEQIVEKPQLTRQGKTGKSAPETVSREPQIVPAVVERTKEVVWDIPLVEDVIVLEDSHIETTEVFNREEIVLSADAVEIIGDLERFESLLEEELKVKLIGTDKFRSGDNKYINIFVCRGKNDEPVSNASIMVKVIGSDFRPVIYHAKADLNGTAKILLKLPNFRSGRAAILIRTIIDGEEAELRRVITPE